MYLDIEFSKLFKDKHGDKIFDDINSKIKAERVEECDYNYIEAIYRVAFLGYFGLDNKALNNMLKDIDCKDDIEKINKLHKETIKIIRKYIIEANRY